MIFAFSAQDGKKSGKTSGKVTTIVAETVVKDFEEKTPNEKNQIIEKYHPNVRKLAHMTEFGTLGALIFLFLLTFRANLFLQYIGSLFATFLYACTDEWHQRFTDNRGARFTDVMIDLLGAVICSTVILLTVVWIRSRLKKKQPSVHLLYGSAAPQAERTGLKMLKNMQTTHYYLTSKAASPKLHIAVAADLHNAPYQAVIDQLRLEQPDLILIPGDLMDDAELSDSNALGYTFLCECAAMAPTYYSIGNHEIACYHKGNPWRHPVPTPLSDEVKQRIQKTGAILLDNEECVQGDLCICGLTSGINGRRNEPDSMTLKKFADAKGVRILLCHHPEYFMPYIRKTPIELTVSGHAHGGQWRVFGRGVYAPGQGIFPKYTSGVVEDRCVISRGLGNHTHFPRIFNRPELVMIHWGYPIPDSKKKLKRSKKKEK